MCGGVGGSRLLQPLGLQFICVRTSSERTAHHQAQNEKAGTQVGFTESHVNLPSDLSSTKTRPAAFGSMTAKKIQLGGLEKLMIKIRKVKSHVFDYGQQVVLGELHEGAT